MQKVTEKKLLRTNGRKVTASGSQVDSNPLLRSSQYVHLNLEFQSEFVKKTKKKQHKTVDQK